MRVGEFAKNVSYTALSNISSFLIAALVTFLVPKYTTVENYGYFQLYIFYSSYIGFLHFGWVDGFYLRYGGEYYSKLDKHRTSAQFLLLMGFEAFISLGIVAVALAYIEPQEKSLVATITAGTILFVILRTLLQYILQCTNRIKEYSATVIIERTSYLVLILICIATGHLGFTWLIASDAIGKAIALALSIYYCRDAVFCMPESWRDAFKEAEDNISVGIKLMLSNIASMLIIGIVRFSIERQWDIATFGKVSLSLSVSNMLMVLVNAAALVMFPTLRRVQKSKYAKLYELIRSALMLTLLGMLVIYYPVKALLTMWLPQYSDSLHYMAILFPICVFESKNSMLVSTYMKTLRMERKMMIINVVTLIVSIACTVYTVYYSYNLDYAVLSIVVLMAVKCILGEVVLAPTLKIDVVKNIIIEVVAVAVFVYSSWCIGGIKGMMVYIAAYIFYLIIERKNISNLLLYLRLKGNI